MIKIADATQLPDSRDHNSKQFIPNPEPLKAKFLSYTSPSVQIQMPPEMYGFTTPPIFPKQTGLNEKTMFLQPINTMSSKKHSSPETNHSLKQPTAKVLHVPGAFDILQRGNLPSIILKNNNVFLELIPTEQIH